MSTVPAKGYLLCAEPRSGSAFLGRTLSSTGLLGRPAEYFCGRRARSQIRRDKAEAVDSLLGQATTANGIYGIKIFSYQFDAIARSGWIERLPDLRFIHLERRDLLGQAISYVRAMQTGRFVSANPEARAPVYDRRAIAGQIARLAAAGARWRCYFARNGIQPLALAYEDVIADPDGAVAMVAAWLGLDEAPRADHGQVDVEIQRDAVSAEWRARFLAEAGDLGRLDDWPFGPFRRSLRAVRDAVGAGKSPSARTARRGSAGAQSALEAEDGGRP